MDETRIGLILMLLREGSARHAIKAYEEEAGVSYFSARRSVRELARKNGIPMHNLRALSLAIIALAGLLTLVLVY